MSRCHRQFPHFNSGKFLMLLAYLTVASFGQQTSQKWSDVNYAGDGQVYHNLDIYLPMPSQASYPVVIDIYGSAWMSDNGKGTSPDALGSALLNAGYAVVSPNYRSSSDSVFPAEIQDIKAVVRFVRGKAATYKFDTTFIGITGQSSGGHLAALTGTSGGVKIKKIGSAAADIEGELGTYTSKSSSVDAVADWFGPTNFLVMDSCGSQLVHNADGSPESSLIGGPIQNNKDKVALADPITYIDAQDPPFLIIHGDADPLVPICESFFLNQALQQAGVTSTFVTVPGGGHGTGTTVEPYITQMVTFFDNARKNGPTSIQHPFRSQDSQPFETSFDLLGRKCPDGLPPGSGQGSIIRSSETRSKGP